MKLPETGHNIQIAHLLGSLEDGELFGKMSRDLDYVFPILAGKIMEYQNDNMGIFVINVDDEHLDAVTGYLTQRNYNWHELESAVEEA